MAREPRPWGCLLPKMTLYRHDAGGMTDQPRDIRCSHRPSQGSTPFWKVRARVAVHDPARRTRNRSCQQARRRRLTVVFDAVVGRPPSPPNSIQKICATFSTNFKIAVPRPSGATRVTSPGSPAMVCWPISAFLPRTRIRRTGGQIGLQMIELVSRICRSRSDRNSRFDRHCDRPRRGRRYWSGEGANREFVWSAKPQRLRVYKRRRVRPACWWRPPPGVWVGCLISLTSASTHQGLQRQIRVWRVVGPAMSASRFGTPVRAFDSAGRPGHGT